MSKTSDDAIHFIDGQWHHGDGLVFESREPGNQEVVWAGRAASDREVGDAIAAARKAYEKWRLQPLAERIDIARKFQQLVKQHAAELALLISREVGKPLWESKTEVAGVAGKTDLAIDALQTRRGTVTTEMDGFNAVTRFHPIGVLAVLGPFNFPAHLPNGHIVPALIAGNTIVFKPSEHAPAVGAWMAARWHEAGLPPGVLNLVQGARDTGVALAHHRQIDGMLFTGSSGGGKALHQTFGGQPQKILALEMGGNNPLIVHETKDLKAAAYLTVLSAYITAGQRCTCARRLILVDGPQTDDFIAELTSMIGKLTYGFYSDDPEPFMGTVISAEAGRYLLSSQRELLRSDGELIVEMQSHRDCEALLSPGLIDVTAVSDLSDEELFGPFLNVMRVDSFEAAIEAANNTRYGLSAGLISDRRELYETFIARIRAGVVNWNRQTTGASGKLPFGGCGLSGNYRPSGYYASDYCSYPVASLESETATLPEKPMTGINW